MQNTPDHMVLEAVPDGGDGTAEEGCIGGYPRRTQENVLHQAITAKADGFAH